MTAYNLLDLESKNNMIAATLGTSEDDEIIKRLQEQSYAHLQGDERDAKKKDFRDKVGANDENELEDTSRLGWISEAHLFRTD